MASATTGGNNTAIGHSALEANTTGTDNVAVGYQALDANTTGTSNTAVGFNTLGGVTTGTGNVAVGRNAGSSGTPLTTGTDNIYVGINTAPSANNVTREVVLGATNNQDTTGKGSNTAFINANGGNTFNGANTTVFATVSDQRIKKNIVENTEGLEIISQLRVCNFEYRLPEEITDLPKHAAVQKEGVQLGVIAQELQQVCPDCVTEQSTGVLSVDTDEIFWHMVNAIKELSVKCDALQAEINTLKGN
jgi:hypothetical protein